MQPRTFLIIAAVALLGAACENPEPTTNGTGGGGASSSSSSSSGASSSSSSNASSSNASSSNASSSSGSGGSGPCAPVFAFSGTEDAQSIDRTYCKAFLSDIENTGDWMTFSQFFDAPQDPPSETGTVVLWGDGAYGDTAPALGGVLELPAKDQSPALRLCLGPTTRNKIDLSTSSLSTFGTCPGQPTSDSLKVTASINGGSLSGNVGAAPVSATIKGFSCSGDLCTFTFTSGGELLVWTADILVPGTSAAIVEAYARLPGQSAMQVYCGSNGSKVSISADFVINVVINGTTTPGTCPGTPVNGQVAGNHLP